MEETQAEIDDLNASVKHLKKLVFCDFEKRFKLEALNKMHHDSRAALAELVQVAAVIDKFFNKVKGES